jgi:hypothetical protein
VSASPGKIEIPVSFMSVMGSEVSHLENIMSDTAKCSTSGEVEKAFPGLGQVTDLKFDMFLDVSKSLFF